MNSTKNNSYMTIPLGDRAHRQAQQNARLQVDAEKALQVYRNTLMVYAAHSYLEILQIDSDLNQSEGWNIATLTLADVATLHLPRLGDVECRFVGLNEPKVALPTADAEIIGTLVFQGDSSDLTTLEEVAVRGWFKSLGADSALEPLGQPSMIEIQQLQPMDTLLDYFEAVQWETVLEPVLWYCPGESIESVRADLEKIYQGSEELYFEYQIGQFLKANRQKALEQAATDGTTAEPLLAGGRKHAEPPGLIREYGDAENPDRALQSLAAELAEQLQLLWGRLE
jgi:Protein of unknown function (DUF1822)